MSSGNTINKFGFSFFKTEFLGQIKEFSDLETKLEYLGPIFYFEKKIGQDSSISRVLTDINSC